jgi:hypothetical protein
MRLLVSGATTTLEELASAWPNHLGRLLTPATGNNPDRMASLPWAADNSAFSAWDEPAFVRLVARLSGRPACLFLAVPDVVGDAHATLEAFRSWVPRLRPAGLPLALVGQDGAAALPWDDFDSYFIGGTDAWKLSRASWHLAQEAKDRGKHLHMGRVNSIRRLDVAYAWGCDSVDGSGMSMFPRAHIPRFLRHLKHLDSQPLLVDQKSVHVG